MKLSMLPRRGFLIAATVVGVSTWVACQDVGPVDLATMMIYLPGNDTVLVDIASGDVTSGPITMFENSLDFAAEFFANDGTPDGRITEQNYRLDVTAANPALVSFNRSTMFSGSLQKLATGSTSISFALFSFETQGYLFDLSVPIDLY